MLLDSKSRIVDNTFTKEGRYFIMQGSEPASFAPVSLANPDFGSEGFSLGADSCFFAQLLSPQGVPNELVTNEGPVTSTRKTWARVTKIRNLTTNSETTLPDFSSSWKPLTEFDNYQAGFFDIIRSVVSGTYDNGAATWTLGSLKSVGGTSISVNGEGRETKHVWKSYKDQKIRQAEEIVRPDILAQQEFSQYVNGLCLPPVITNGEGNVVPLKNAPIGNFQCNRISSRTIRNRLVESGREFLEVEIYPMNFPSDVGLEAKWIPVERKKFKMSFGGAEYTVQTAQALDIVRFDRNLYFIGKIVPVAMPSRPDVTTNTFLRMFTIIFEDGT